MFGVEIGMAPELLGLLFLVAVAAGCFDAIAGGGGLVTVPALLLAGLDPVAAIATNKLQGAAGTVSSTVAFARRGLIPWRTAWPIAAIAAAVSVLGALSASVLPAAWLEAGVPILLVAIALYFGLSRRMGEADVKARLTRPVFLLALVPPIAFYDGLFGPGAGSFYMAGFVAALGYGVVKATAHTKLANAASNLGGLALFAATGAVVWPIGLVMAAGALIGAQIGAALAVRFGARLIRPLLVAISCAMAIRLLADAQNPLRVWAAGG
ncbi:TSUP family transporter [Salinarimonas sp.]|uniref:TSUP family transporter n=1 Tax=Salinarimonas sp. TaxID=2766526 RepID=UPI0035B5105E